MLTNDPPAAAGSDERHWMTCGECCCDAGEETNRVPMVESLALRLLAARGVTVGCDLRDLLRPQLPGKNRRRDRWYQCCLLHLAGVCAAAGTPVTVRPGASEGTLKTNQ